MRISTKQAEALAAATSRREETYASPFGAGRLVTSGDLPLEVGLPGETTGGIVSQRAHSRWALLLGRYFAGERVTFDLDVEAYAVVVGLTVFERDVYAALGRVPYGTVVSYRELAAAAGRPRAYRAVGSAMARNRLPVILPCHRVVRNDGWLGAYGDDPAWKERLLGLEGVEVKGGRLA
jgi:O-6-methylguanine DNA methyltransferase